MIKKYLYIFFFLLTLAFPILGQTKLGLYLPDNTNKVTLPFAFVNNLIVIPITINNQVTIKFILDTGANNAILTEKIFGDIIGLDYERQINISGAGAITSVSAQVAHDVRLRLPKGIRGRYVSMLILDEDYIQLKKNLGEDVYGIIGFDVFSRFVVEVDYSKLLVTFYRPDSFKARRKYDAYDLTIRDSKPFIDAVIHQESRKDTLNLMVDTGASHALLLDVEESPVLTLPDTTLETTLGHGLGGQIFGRVGRVDKFSVGDYDLKDILVSIPDPGAYNKTVKRGARNGTIGGQILLHFNIIFDYNGGKIYLTKNDNFSEPFRYDMSGLRISYFENPRRYEITSIMDFSPASKTRLKVGDEVVNINGNHIDNSKLSHINNMLRSRPGRKVRIIAMRDGERFIAKFKLKKLI